jgi:hypothetical protein
MPLGPCPQPPRRSARAPPPRSTPRAGRPRPCSTASSRATSRPSSRTPARRTSGACPSTSSHQGRDRCAREGPSSEDAARATGGAPCGARRPARGHRVEAAGDADAVVSPACWFRHHGDAGGCSPGRRGRCHSLAHQRPDQGARDPSRRHAGRRALRRGSWAREDGIRLGSLKTRLSYSQHDEIRRALVTAINDGRLRLQGAPIF